jgi:hypothetical protein
MLKTAVLTKMLYPQKTYYSYCYTVKEIEDICKRYQLRIILIISWSFIWKSSKSIIKVCSKKSCLCMEMATKILNRKDILQEEEEEENSEFIIDETHKN